MDTTLAHREDRKIVLPSWERVTPIVRLALVCGVLALALVSIICLGAGIPVIPGWLQGSSAMSGVALGAAIGIMRGPAA
jgi:hypothetical protein